MILQSLLKFTIHKLLQNDDVIILIHCCITAVQLEELQLRNFLYSQYYYEQMKKKSFVLIWWNNRELREQ